MIVMNKKIKLNEFNRINTKFDQINSIEQFRWFKIHLKKFNFDKFNE